MRFSPFGFEQTTAANTPAGATCYTLNLTQYLTGGECYYYPNEYEYTQNLTLTLDATPTQDVRIQGYLTNGVQIDVTIPANTYPSIQIYGSTYGCGNYDGLIGNGFTSISVTALNGLVVLQNCTDPTTGSDGYRNLFPAGALFLNSAYAKCSNNTVMFSISGGMAPYSASVTKDASGNPIWDYLNIPPLYTASVSPASTYFPAISDSTGTIVKGETLYTCSIVDMTYIVDNIGTQGIGAIYYPPLIVSGSQSKGSYFKISGSYNTLIGVTGVALSGSTFLGWSNSSGSTSGIFTTSSTIQFPLTSTGSVLYAIVTKNVVSSSFCYYNSNPIGTSSCDACSSPITIYYNGDALTGSSYTSLNWYQDVNFSTLSTTGYYKKNSTTSAPIYQVTTTGGSQTRTLTGFCTDAILTC